MCLLTIALLSTDNANPADRRGVLWYAGNRSSWLGNPVGTTEARQSVVRITSTTTARRNKPWLTA